MSIFLLHYFEELKNCVIKVAGLLTITPGDCKLLSQLILLKTHQRISETTLKRVYGFAYSKFKPSTFTIEALSQYCGHDSWNAFCQAQDKKNKNAKFSFEVNGNCEQCKKRIEKAAYGVAGVKSASWDIESHQLTGIINEEKASVPQLKKAVAKAGHDSDGGSAPVGH
ncbi:MAG: cation transporter [Sphingobacteriales bacterium]|nr:MAG: cation transporter [Sphingobacteriales bacterium]